MVIVINLRVISYSNGKIYKDIDKVPAEGRVAMVLGAGVEDDGSPSNTLYDRTLTGVQLYKAGKAKQILLTGGGREPFVMKDLAVNLGVPESDLLIDDLGTRTYESCYRAKEAFHLDRVIVVTQDYHLPRSIYLCRNLSVDAIGFDAKRRLYIGENFFWIREYISRCLAWYDINLR